MAQQTGAAALVGRRLSLFNMARAVVRHPDHAGAALRLELAPGGEVILTPLYITYIFYYRESLRIYTGRCVNDPSAGGASLDRLHRPPGGQPLGPALVRGQRAARVVGVLREVLGRLPVAAAAGGRGIRAPPCIFH